MSNDRSVDLLNLLKAPQSAPGLQVVKINTTDPIPVTLIFEGTTLALDLDIFEVPVECYPLKVGDRLLAFPLVNTDNGQRYGIIAKLDGGLTMATMTGATTLQVTGIGREYTASDLIMPAGALEEGDVVSLTPVGPASAIKYAILGKY